MEVQIKHIYIYTLKRYVVQDLSKFLSKLRFSLQSLDPILNLCFSCKWIQMEPLDFLIDTRCIKKCRKNRREKASIDTKTIMYPSKPLKIKGFQYKKYLVSFIRIGTTDTYPQYKVLLKVFGNFVSKTMETDTYRPKPIRTNRNLKSCL